MSARMIDVTLFSAVLVLSLGFALGIFPPFQGNDEHGHFIRTFEISRGNLIGRSVPELRDGHH